MAVATNTTYAANQGMDGYGTTSHGGRFIVVWAVNGINQSAGDSTVVLQRGGITLDSVVFFHAQTSKFCRLIQEVPPLGPLTYNVINGLNIITAQVNVIAVEVYP